MQNLAELSTKRIVITKFGIIFDDQFDLFKDLQKIFYKNVFINSWHTFNPQAVAWELRSRVST